MVGGTCVVAGRAKLVSARIGQLLDAQRDVIEVLAFGEPLGVPLLVGLTEAAAVEQAEARWPRCTRFSTPTWAGPPPLTRPPGC